MSEHCRVDFDTTRTRYPIDDDKDGADNEGDGTYHRRKPSKTLQPESCNFEHLSGFGHLDLRRRLCS